jgi:tRNA(fMet)-specific endonuclease VapC
MILLDSDHVSVLLQARDVRRPGLVARLTEAADSRALPIIVVEEHLRGWLAQIHRIADAHKQIVPYLNLANLIDFLLDWPIVGWNEPAADHFKRLRKSGVRIGTQDLKIACVALAHDALLLSANLRDFELVPGLQVADWLR